MNSSSRANILGAIRQHRAASSAPGGNVPSAGPGASSEVPGTGNLLEELRSRALRSSATFAVVARPDEISAAVADWLGASGLAARAVLGADICALYEWQHQAGVDWVRGTVAADGDVLVTGALSAIALEGAIVLASSPTHRTEQAFLAAAHVVVLRESDVVATFADLWATLRRRYAPGEWPRSLNLVLGPSRTADLGVPSRLGAHGPARVHIIVLRSSSGGQAC